MRTASPFKLPWNNGLRITLWTCRILVGVLFIFSGLVKANDPLGLAYKLHEYYEVFADYTLLSWMSNSFFVNTALPTSILMCVLEMALGAAFIIGVWPKVTTWVSFLLMVWFTFLTGFSHYTGRVSECGCFGTVIPLTAYQSFIKDLILDVPVIFMLLYNNRFTLLLKRIPSFVAAGTAALASLIFTLMAYNHLPIIDFDFLPFKDALGYEVGGNMCELRTLPPDADPGLTDITLVYRNKTSGATEEIDVPGGKWTDATMARVTELSSDSTWEFMEQKSTVVREPEKPAINIIISDRDGNDITDGILLADNFKFLLVVYDVHETVTKRWEGINQLQAESEKAGWSWYGLSASGGDEIEKFRHQVQIPIEFYSADGTELKTMIRSNPGLILMNGCVILGMWHWRDIPSWEHVRDKYLKP